MRERRCIRNGEDDTIPFPVRICGQTLLEKRVGDLALSSNTLLPLLLLDIVDLFPLRLTTSMYRCEAVGQCGGRPQQRRFIRQNRHSFSPALSDRSDAGSGPDRAMSVQVPIPSNCNKRNESPADLFSCHCRLVRMETFL